MLEHDKEHTETPVLRLFDFSVPLSLTVLQRLDRAVQAVRLAQEIRGDTGYTYEFGYLPNIPPTGASDLELLEIQKQFEVEFSAEYLEFLRRWRYIIMTDGRKISGFDYEGVYATTSPWISDTHLKDSQCMVIGDCCIFADGDQLLVPISEGKYEQRVLLYLHEDGPKIEEYTPSFSLALWRLAFERL